MAVKITSILLNQDSKKLKLPEIQTLEVWGRCPETTLHIYSICVLTCMYVHCTCTDIRLLMYRTIREGDYDSRASRDLYFTSTSKKVKIKISHTMNYPKKPGFNLYQSRHCAYITYSEKTWFLKFSLYMYIFSRVKLL